MTTVVSAPRIVDVESFSWRKTASAFSRASRTTYEIGSSPGLGSSGMCAGCTSNVKPAWVSNSRRRGEAEARTSILELWQAVSRDAASETSLPDHARCVSVHLDG